MRPMSKRILMMLGIVAAMSGRWVSEVVRRFVDLLLAFPALLLAVMFGAIYGASTLTAMLAIGIATASSHAARTAEEIPSPSLPNTMQQSFVRSACDFSTVRTSWPKSANRLITADPTMPRCPATQIRCLGMEVPPRPDVLALSIGRRQMG